MSFLRIHRKSIPIQIIGESLYEKDVLFYFTIGEPKSMAGKLHIFLTILTLVTKYQVRNMERRLFNHENAYTEMSVRVSD